jgi:hypothetical protein
MSLSTKTTYYQYVGIAVEGASKDGFLSKRMVKQPEGYFPSKAEAKQAARMNENDAYFNKDAAKKTLEHNQADKFKGLNHPIQATVSRSMLPGMIEKAVAAHGAEAVTVIDDSVLVDESKSQLHGITHGKHPLVIAGNKQNLPREVTSGYAVAPEPEVKPVVVPQQPVAPTKPYAVVEDENKVKSYSGRGWTISGLQRYAKVLRWTVQKSNGSGFKAPVTVVPRGILFPSHITGLDKNDLSWLIRTVMNLEGGAL